MSEGQEAPQPQWENTIRGGERIRRAHPQLFEEPSAEAPHGLFAGRRIIGRDTPINGGVYVGSGTREAIVVDDKQYSRELQQVYSQLDTSMERGKGSGKSIFDYVYEISKARLGGNLKPADAERYNILVMHQLTQYLIKLLPTKPIYAHCDIPCGIYDPHTAQLASQTVLKMVQKINELPTENPSVNDRNNFVRMVKVKEEHVEACKREVLILWTDYFKSEHLEKFPDLHELVWKTTKLCSDNKRSVDEQLAQQLVDSVDRIAEVFAETKK